ncbi:MAG: Holliday junction branch migration protein RuvA [Anaerolineae bacterium]|uniref:Holliday junction branch migration protein RuvA n=1 Tax=Candidatus Amarolinea dominans TaxID=3140696 RepID=UPI001DEFB87D|nr:Holliday junction branch migration protein RuvA [Anaerolineae bacterium]MBK7199609.1 Holliday junction branch migration protein RuvA [Anaerolineae bacterium]MBK9094740.1 Holliday junction branch migration protein RuvA [Anaerolineae bacterium]MBK9234013.1 Holliday junction branch migration protein RuvA [Anaerolineae bacterium]
MIARLRGQVVARGKDYLIVDVGGIGYKVFVPADVLVSTRTVEEITLHTHLQVREDNLSLFGLASEEALDLFHLLLTVPGVGPKGTLTLLSAMSPEAIRLAVSQEQPGILARVPGVGKRTAEKIVMTLRDRIGTVAATEELLAMTTADAEVIDALTALGYSVVEAQRAVQRIPREISGVEERLRHALSQFAE